MEHQLAVSLTAFHGRDLQKLALKGQWHYYRFLAQPCWGHADALQWWHFALKVLFRPVGKASLEARAMFLQLSVHSMSNTHWLCFHKRILTSQAFQNLIWPFNCSNRASNLGQIQSSRLLVFAYASRFRFSCWFSSNYSSFYRWRGKFNGSFVDFERNCRTSQQIFSWWPANRSLQQHLVVGKKAPLAVSSSDFNPWKLESVRLPNVLVYCLLGLILLHLPLLYPNNYIHFVQA